MFPKILILEQPFDNQTGGGITLSNLFAGWDRDKLAVVCPGYLYSHGTNFQACSSYYQVGSLENKWKFPLNLIQRKYYSGPIEKPDSISTKIVAKADPNRLRMKLINNIFYPFLNYSGLIHLLNRIELSKKLCKWIDNYNPDIIYVQPSSLQSVIFCRMVQSYINKPMVFHMMDDWPLMVKENSLLGSYWFNRINIELLKLFKQTSLFFSISDLMADEYKERYGKDFTAFHNPIEVSFWKKYRKLDYNLKSTATILYAGRVGTGIDDSLKVIANAVKIVNENKKHKLIFALQTPEKPQWLGNFEYVRHNPYVEYGELPRVFAEADILILPYDFDEASLKFIRLSMPTKAPEYLASGTPVIFFAPETTALVQYAKKNECGLIVKENCPNSLALGISKLLEDKRLREKFSRKGIEVSENYHNAKNIRKDFQREIISLI